MQCTEDDRDLHSLSECIYCRDYLRNASRTPYNSPIYNEKDGEDELCDT